MKALRGRSQENSMTKPCDQLEMIAYYAGGRLYDLYMFPDFGQGFEQHLVRLSAN
jgi:hypothetical protein